MARFMNDRSGAARGEPLEKGTKGMQSWIKRTNGPRAEGSGVPSKVYGVMAMTTLLTFATLMTSYQMVFSQSVFA